MESLNIILIPIDEVKPRYKKSQEIDDPNKNVLLCKIQNKDTNKTFYRTKELYSNDMVEGFDDNYQYIDDNVFEIISWAYLPMG